MKKSTGIIAFGAAALVAAVSVSGDAAAQRRRAPTPVDGPHISRCHMGGCGWIDISSVRTVRQTAAGRLVQVTMREGGSEHRNNRYPRSARGAHIRWNAATSDNYFFCSTRRPTAVYRSDGAWTAIQLNPGSPSGASEAVTTTYSYVCHPGAEMTEARARRLGYHSEEGAEVTLQRPEDVLDLH